MTVDSVVGFQGFDVEPLEHVLVPRGGRVWSAVLMPWPFDGTQSCQGDAVFERTRDTASDLMIGLAPDVREYHSRVCAACPVLVGCREWALAHEEYLWFAGMDPVERGELRSERGQVVVGPGTGVYGIGYDAASAARQAVKVRDIQEQEDWR